jgi:3',5'-cyclic AMP phosphodiesterase CpdA
MRSLAHLSDLHFGAHDPPVVEALLAALAALAPDIVVVSGDLTQRARRSQFRAADAFLRRIEANGCAVVVVPGNHDLPLFNVTQRLLSPLRRWQRYIATGRREHYFDEEVAIVGLNTARSLNLIDGRLSVGQVNGLTQSFAGAAPQAIRLLVTHHPLVPMQHHEPVRPLRQATHALATARAARVRLLLAGHLHHAGVIHGPADLANPSADPHILVIQAGTATSWRLRGTPNSFNLLRIDDGTLVVDLMESDGSPFRRRLSCRYRAAHNGGWRADLGSEAVAANRYPDAPARA